MKIIVVWISLCSLLLLSPITIGVSIQNTVPAEPAALTQKRVSILEEPPAWATGNFSGVWGLSFLGYPLAPLGWITGYYQNIGLGRLESVYAAFNQTNATSFLRGIMIWIFFMGGAGSLQTGNGTWVSGIGVANETHFYWRLNPLIGPSYYIFCTYTKFTNQTTSSLRTCGNIRPLSKHLLPTLDLRR
jgi:hypothetical protein